MQGRGVLLPKKMDRRGNLWVKSMDSGGVEETT